MSMTNEKLWGFSLEDIEVPVRAPGSQPDRLTRAQGPGSMQEQRRRRDTGWEGHPWQRFRAIPKAGAGSA